MSCSICWTCIDSYRWWPCPSEILVQWSGNQNLRGIKSSLWDKFCTATSWKWLIYWNSSTSGVTSTLLLACVYLYVKDVIFCSKHEHQEWLNQELFENIYKRTMPLSEPFCQSLCGLFLAEFLRVTTPPCDKGSTINDLGGPAENSKRKILRQRRKRNFEKSFGPPLFDPQKILAPPFSPLKKTGPPLWPSQKILVPPQTDGPPSR